MKKFYILSLAVATAATSWAATEISAVNHEITMTKEASTCTSVQKAPSITSAQDLTGSYAWNYESLLEEDKGAQQSEIQIMTDSDMAENEVLIVILGGYIEGTVDVEAGTLTIPNRQYIALKDNWQPIYLYFKKRDANGDLIPGSSGEDAVGTIDGYTITFPEETVWAIGVPDSDNEQNTLLAVSNKFVNLAGGDDDDDVDEFEKGWSDYATGMFTDGWIICAYYRLDEEDNKVYYNAEEYPWEVTVQQNDSDPTLFRIYDPYNAPTRPLKFGDGGKGAIVYSIEDPNFVLVYPDVYSGYTSKDREIRCMNLEGFYSAAGYEKDYIEANITNYKKSYVDEEANVIYFNQCRINYPGVTANAYVWGAGADAMHGKLVINKTNNGLENVSLEADNSPVEYYNLQGIREANPSNGIYIMRRGTAVSKIVLK